MATDALVALIEVPPIPPGFDSIYQAILLATQVRLADPPNTVLFGSITVPNGTPLNYDPTLPPGEAGVNAILQRLIALIAATGGDAPDPGGTWNGGDTAPDILPVTTWAWHIFVPGDPESTWTLGICINLDVPDVWIGLPGDGSDLELAMALFSAELVPAPFAQNIIDYMAGNNDKLELLTQMIRTN